MFVSGILFGFAPCTNLTLHRNPQCPSHPQRYHPHPRQLYWLLLPFGFAFSPLKPKLCRVSLIVRFCFISDLLLADGVPFFFFGLRSSVAFCFSFLRTSVAFWVIDFDDFVLAFDDWMSSVNFVGAINGFTFFWLPFMGYLLRSKL